MNLQKAGRDLLTDKEDKPMVTRGGEEGWEGIVREFWMVMYTHYSI